VDGTLIEAWASMKSFRPKHGRGEPPAPGRNGERDFHGEKRSNQTHASSTDPDARLYKKSPGSAAMRKRIEEVFGWIKTAGGLRKTRHRGTALVGWAFTLAAAAYNVVRIPKLLAAAV
jgi:hypothetical protein